MPYYAAGDYYRGDYYRGDPGIFDVLKKGFQVAKGAVTGFVRGGPLGAVAGAGRALVAPSRTLAPPVSVSRNIPQLAAPTPRVSIGTFGPDLNGAGSRVPRGAPGAVPIPGERLERFLPGGQSGYAAAPPGYHVNKAYLRYLRARDLGRDVQDPFSEPRAVNLIVKNRRMDPLNVRALRSSVRRQSSMKSVISRALRGSGWKISRSGLGGGRKGRRKKR